jgi:hypothetical protein
VADTVILPMANSLLACLAAELALNPDPPALVCLRAGDLVIHDANAATSVDTVCCPGLAYVRIGSMFPSSNFPDPDNSPLLPKGNGCFPVAWAVELVMGVVRCIPGMGDPAGPDCADWTLVATHDANDLDAMRRALCCWAPTLPKTRLWLAGASTVEMNADCIERQMSLTVSVPKCC